MKQQSLNSKGSKVAQKPLAKKRKAVGGKENADSAPELTESNEKEGVRKRRRVHFKSGRLFERKKPTLVLTSVQPE